MIAALPLRSGVKAASGSPRLFASKCRGARFIQSDSVASS